MSTLWITRDAPVDSPPLAPVVRAPAAAAFLDQSADIPVARPAPDAPANTRPLVRPDAGWLFLIAGIALIAVTVLIPAQRDLLLARWQRDRATAIERHKHNRIANYGAYLVALERSDDNVLLSLAASQLNKSPAGRIPLLPPPDPARTSASVFPSLEPAPLRLVETPDLDSRASLLERWSTNDRIRLWMLAGGVFTVLIGLLPAARD